MTIYKRIAKRINTAMLQKKSHGDLLVEAIDAVASGGGMQSPVFVETGSGLSTLALARKARELGGRVYSCDFNEQKVEELKKSSGGAVDEVEFLFGDSLESLRKIMDSHDHIDLLFLDSAASALHTFREFMIAEPRLGPGSVVVIDNAALPHERRVLSPVRKGKIVVPYLLASPFWKVEGHPGAGDSMVSAFFDESPDHADPEFEDPEYVDNWRSLFERKLARGE